MSASDWALLCILSAFWGGSFFFNKIAVSELPPITVALGRVGGGAALLLLVARAMGDAVPPRSLWGPLAVMGLFNSVLPFSLILWSQTHVASGLASILIATTPLFSVLVAHMVTEDDKLTAGRGVGLAAGLVGVTVMIGPDVLRELGTHVAAQGTLLFSAFLYGASGVYGRRFRPYPPATIAAGQMVFATLMLAPAAAIIDRIWTLPPPSAAALGSIAGLAVLSTTLGYIIYFRVLARAGATNLMLVNFLVPVSAILLGVGILGEALAPRQIAGMLIIGIGLAAIDGRLARWAVALRASRAAPLRRPLRPPGS
ncbi:MAG TPA: EamA family transporter [Xanthobacteraceae bacterium]|nr:EamA family transporter [Xanthobacteraceae bacterium]